MQIPVWSSAALYIHGSCCLIEEHNVTFHLAEHFLLPPLHHLHFVFHASQHCFLAHFVVKNNICTLSPSHEVGTRWEELKCSQVTGLSKCVPRLCRWLIPGYIGTIGSHHHPVNAVIGGASPSEAANLQWHPCTRRTDAQTSKCSTLGPKHLFWKGPPTGSQSDCIRQTCGGSSGPQGLVINKIYKYCVYTFVCVSATIF